METLLGIDAEFTRVLVEVLGSLRPLAQQHNVPLERLGDFDTLADRVHAEIAASNSIVSFVPMVGVWSRVSSNGSKRPQNK
jgi:hypothetical protein